MPLSGASCSKEESRSLPAVNGAGDAVSRGIRLAEMLTAKRATA